MSKTATVLPMKGLHTPRFLIWCKGFLHGKILHTGGLDPETNTLSSGYITGQTKRFRHACVLRREEAETKLTKAWTEADQLLIEYSTLSAALADSDGQNARSETSAQARARERAAGKRASRKADRQTILKNMAGLVNTIRGEYDTAHDQMEATAESLLSVYATYGHGLLMKPIYQNVLPELLYEDCADQILTAHANTWNALVTIVEEAQKQEG